MGNIISGLTKIDFKTCPCSYACPWLHYTMHVMLTFTAMSHGGGRRDSSFLYSNTVKLDICSWLLFGKFAYFVLF